MTTLSEARFALDRLLLERHAAGLPTDVDQIDCSAAETSTAASTDVCALIYFVGATADDVGVLTFELPHPPSLFDHRAVSQALLRPERETVH